VGRLALALGLAVGPAESAGPSALRFTVQLLTGYAQSGLRMTDWPDHGCAHDAIQEVCEALYSRAGEGTFGIGDLESEVDPDTAIGVVLLAAHARETIEGGRPASARELAALAGVDSKSLYRVCALRGDIVDGRVKAKTARRWLMARGIGGFQRDE
jgi:hypothetical protein